MLVIEVRESLIGRARILQGYRQGGASEIKAKGLAVGGRAGWQK